MKSPAYSSINKSNNTNKMITMMMKNSNSQVTQYEKYQSEVVREPSQCKIMTYTNCYRRKMQKNLDAEVNVNQ